MAAEPPGTHTPSPPGSPNPIHRPWKGIITLHRLPLNSRNPGVAPHTPSSSRETKCCVDSTNIEHTKASSLSLTQLIEPKMPRCVKISLLFPIERKWGLTPWMMFVNWWKKPRCSLMIWHAMKGLMTEFPLTNYLRLLEIKNRHFHQVKKRICHCWNGTWYSHGFV